MQLNKEYQYIFRLGSDNQYRLHWNGSAWNYEFLAGGVIFDQQYFPDENELVEGLAVHGLTLNQFQMDQSGAGENYSKEIQEKMKKLIEMDIDPCSKHGLMAKNFDGTCEACAHTDYPDDFKGTEG